MSSMSGPRKIIDLDSVCEEEWKVDTSAVHLFQSQLWTHLQIGCVLCVEAERADPKGQTLQSSDGKSRICLTHGPLVEVGYSIRRDVVIKLGHLERRGERVFSDVVLIPSQLSDAERNALLERLIDVAAEEEDGKDPLSDE